MISGVALLKSGVTSPEMVLLGIALGDRLYFWLWV